MKKIIASMIIVLILIGGLFVLTGCGNNKEINNSEKNNNKVETSEKDYSGTYKSDDSSEIVIEKENNTYKVNISIYRLASFSDGIVDEVKNGIIYISATDPNGEKIKFTFNHNTKVLTITETTWNYLSVNDIFIFDY